MPPTTNRPTLANTRTRHDSGRYQIRRVTVERIVERVTFELLDEPCDDETSSIRGALMLEASGGVK